MSKKAQSSVELHELIAHRWSPRAFDPDRAVSSQQQLALAEAARWAPSCFNDQPWRYLFFDRFDDNDSWSHALSCLTEKNQMWAKQAPLLILSCAMPHFRQNEKPNRWAQHDTGAASLNLFLQANAMGLAVHEMGGFDADKCKHLFEIPQPITPMAMIAVGHQASVDTLPENFRDGETATRERLPMVSSFFRGKWGKPLVR